MEAFLSSVQPLLKVVGSLKLAHRPGQDPTLLMEMSPGGLKMSTESTPKDMVAHAWLPGTVFQEFHFESPADLSVCVSLNTTLNCLAMLGDRASVRLTYDPTGNDAELRVVLMEDDQTRTECVVSTLLPVALADIEVRGAAEVDGFILTDAVPFVSVLGIVGEEDKDGQVQIHLRPVQGLPAESTEVVTFSHETATGSSLRFGLPYVGQLFRKYEVGREHVHSYRVPTLLSCAKSLHSAGSLRVQINEQGTLSLQNIVHFPGCGAEVHIELLVASLSMGGRGRGIAEDDGAPLAKAPRLEPIVVGTAGDDWL
mmetsp:Transcript_41334/g.93504  ORF Transcript_41334/g.93504 Transcript_41334/m.93504 type:complete len:312 (-) Transcript_41334:226-1161(-)